MPGLLRMNGRFWLQASEERDPVSVSAMLEDGVAVPLEKARQALDVLAKNGTGCGSADDLVIQLLSDVERSLQAVRAAKVHVEEHERHAFESEPRKR